MSRRNTHWSIHKVVDFLTQTGHSTCESNGVVLKSNPVLDVRDVADNMAP